MTEPEVTELLTTMGQDLSAILLLAAGAARVGATDPKVPATLGDIEAIARAALDQCRTLLPRAA